MSSRNSIGQKLKKTVVYSDSIKIVDYLDGFQTEARGSRMPVGALATQLSNNEQNYTAALASFDLEILNFQSLTRPFGLKHSVYSAGRLRDFEVDSSNPEGEHVFLNNVTKTEYQYKYNGKEFQDELGLNVYDYHARNYDPALGRWQVIDPLAPKYFSHSPYAYTLNNPVYFIDPTGMMAEIGNILGNGDPEEICEGCLVELEEALITAKDTQKSSSFGSRSRSGSLMTMSGFSSSRFSIGRNIFGYNYEKYSDLYNNPDWFVGYKKMYQAKREGEWFAVGVFGGSIVAIFAAPAVITYGSIYAETQVGSYVVQALGKTGIDATAQYLITGDVNWLNAAAGSVLPGKAGTALSPIMSEGADAAQIYVETGKFNPTQSALKIGANYLGNGLGGVAKSVGADNGFNAVQNFIFENGIQSFHNNLQGEIISDGIQNTK